MILTVLLALSICRLLCLDTAATVIFTVIFSLGVFAVTIYCKLAFALDDYEVEVIRSYIKRAREIKRKIRAQLTRSKKAIRIERLPN